MEPTTVTFNRPTITGSGQAILMSAQPTEAAARLRDAVRAAIASVWSTDRNSGLQRPVPPARQPCVCKGDGPAEPVPVAPDAVVTPLRVS
jgi:hypothetical protein